MKYCPLCKRMIEPKNKLRIVELLIAGGIGFILFPFIVTIILFPFTGAIVAGGIGFILFPFIGAIVFGIIDYLFQSKEPTYVCPICNCKDLKDPQDAENNIVSSTPDSSL